MPQSDSPISVVIAEDDALLRHYLVKQLAAQEGFTVLGSVENGRKAVEVVSQLKPRVLLLDLDLPELSGLQVLDRLSGMANPPGVLVLSGQELEDTQLEAARRGAGGFLCKSQAGSLLLPAILAVAAGEFWLSPRLVRRIVGDYSPLVRRIREEDAPVRALTDTEREVLVRIGRGMTNRQIGEELFTSVSTVKVHIQGIFRKLSLQNRAEAAVFAEREGLLQPAELSSTKGR
jgi:DNA-binding NarL/FixJ family response regulator